ncbi:tRNA (cytidine/uridine-2'-O-)-methyltransferase [Ruaniaceae bacterium KH17]|nr:tRNA (cytidine/uridine-2'-O-)-methyltransferase [Ruaniaceae bacterium KH17]
MLHVIFFSPKIPPNTGNAIRMSACTGSALHLVEPLGFEMTDAHLRRAGLDYHDLAHVEIHPNFDAAVAAVPGRIFAFTGHTDRMYTDIEYTDGDALLFGPEPDGLPEEIMSHPAITERVRIHMVPGVRSLNLANSAGIATYEAWRQLGFPGGV